MDNASAKLPVFERYLSVWVILCIIGGIILGKVFPQMVSVLGQMEVAQVNIPIAILIWLMIYPMMVQIDFSSIVRVGQRPKGLLVTLVVNWLIKPFTMALFAAIFFRYIFAAFIGPTLATEYIAGAILLGAAPCTAMVFVWSYLTKGDPAHTLVQVAINDLVILVAFVPIVKFLLGVNRIIVPYDTLIYSTILFVVVPLTGGYLSRQLLIKYMGMAWLENVFLRILKPITIMGLLSTLILLFAFQGNIIIDNPLHIFLIAIPLTIQTYFIFAIGYLWAKKWRIEHSISSPAAMIGASNFFELAVAVAITLFGLKSGAALVTVVGVLTEVPIMLSLVNFSNRTRHWFIKGEAARPGEALRNMKNMNHDEVRRAVRESYGKIAENKQAGCGCSASSCCGPSKEVTAEELSLVLGYSQKDLTAVPAGANLGLGCGDPRAIASLREGETVLDLGSGAGLDCFLAAKAVGEKGRVIGVDMTREMVSKAQENAQKAGLSNIEFRLGEIENLPVADEVIDVIISNCVINLSPEKARVFQEAYRVLKPGGRLAVSDIVATAELPKKVGQDLALYTACMAGASSIADLEAMLQKAGFQNIMIKPKDESREFIRNWSPGHEIEDYVVSASIEASKPAGKL